MNILAPLTSLSHPLFMQMQSLQADEHVLFYYKSHAQRQEVKTAVEWEWAKLRPKLRGAWGILMTVH